MWHGQPGFGAEWHGRPVSGPVRYGKLRYGIRRRGVKSTPLFFNLASPTSPALTRSGQLRKLLDVLPGPVQGVYLTIQVEAANRFGALLTGFANLVRIIANGHH
jgi:hypothetical protein